MNIYKNRCRNRNRHRNRPTFDKLLSFSSQRLGNNSLFSLSFSSSSSLSAFLSETANNLPSPDYDHDNDSDYDNNYNIPRNRPTLNNLPTISSQRLGTNSLFSLSLSSSPVRHSLGDGGSSLSAFLSETANNLPSLDHDHDNDSDYDNNYDIPRNRPPLNKLPTISSQRLGNNSLFSLSLSSSSSSSLSVFPSGIANNLPSPDYDHDNDSDYDNNYNIPRNRPPLDKHLLYPSQRLGTNSQLSLSLSSSPVRHSLGDGGSSLSAFLSGTANNLPFLDNDHDNDSDYD